jgi:hypothetical protein
MALRAGMTWVSLGALWVLLAFAGTASAGITTVDVPEPTSLALLAVGLGGAAWVKLRRRK